MKRRLITDAIYTALTLAALAAFIYFALWAGYYAGIPM